MELKVNQVVLVTLLGIPHRATVHSFPEVELGLDAVFVVIDRETPGKPIPLARHAVRAMPFIAVMDDNSVHDLGGHEALPAAWDAGKRLETDGRRLVKLLDYIDAAALRRQITSICSKQILSMGGVTL